MIAERPTDIDLLRLAFHTAAGFSCDPDTQNGAVLTPQNGFAVRAANHIPTGIAMPPWRLERPAKYRYMEHAERSAIYAAARQGATTEGATLYCCWFACPDCARAIIAAGIREVVGHVTPRRLTPERWESATAAGEAMLREAGVSMRWIAEDLGVTIRFNGESISC